MRAETSDKAYLGVWGEKVRPPHPPFFSSGEALDPHLADSNRKPGSGGRLCPENRKRRVEDTRNVLYQAEYVEDMWALVQDVRWLEPQVRLLCDECWNPKKHIKPHYITLHYITNLKIFFPRFARLAPYRAHTYLKDVLALDAFENYDFRKSFARAKGPLGKHRLSRCSFLGNGSIFGRFSHVTNFKVFKISCSRSVGRSHSSNLFVSCAAL